MLPYYSKDFLGLKLQRMIAIQYSDSVRKINHSLNEKECEEIINSLNTNNFRDKNSENSLEEYKDGTIWVLKYLFENGYQSINKHYIGISSFKDFKYANELYNIGNRVLDMRNRKDIDN